MKNKIIKSTLVLSTILAITTLVILLKSSSNESVVEKDMPDSLEPPAEAASENEPVVKNDMPDSLESLTVAASEPSAYLLSLVKESLEASTEVVNIYKGFGDDGKRVVITNKWVVLKAIALDPNLPEYVEYKQIAQDFLMQRGFNKKPSDGMELKVEVYGEIVRVVFLNMRDKPEDPSVHYGWLNLEVNIDAKTKTVRNYGTW